MPGKIAGYDRLIKLLQDTNDQLADEGFDDRLSEGHLHVLVKSALGSEPLAFAANIIAMAMDARSKMAVKPEKCLDVALALHDRIYGAPKARVRKVDGETQFQLDFAWGSVSEEDIVELERVADDGTRLVTVAAAGENGDD